MVETGGGGGETCVDPLGCTDEGTWIGAGAAGPGEEELVPDGAESAGTAGAPGAALACAGAAATCDDGVPLEEVPLEEVPLEEVPLEEVPLEEAVPACGAGLNTVAAPEVPNVGAAAAGPPGALGSAGPWPEGAPPDADAVRWSERS